jgi:hypothetical protein
MFATTSTLALWGGGPAVAGSFSHSYLSTILFDGATFGTALGQRAILLPKSGTPSFEFSMVLPADYKRNDTVRVALYLLTDISGSSCTTVVQPAGLRRHRQGLAPMFDVGLAGIKPVGGDPSAGFPGSVVARKVFNLRKSPGFPGQQAGDLIALGFLRNTGHAFDSCPNTVQMLGIDISYPSPAP